jgi:hypothetical protein
MGSLIKVTWSNMIGHSKTLSLELTFTRKHSLFKIMSQKGVALLFCEGVYKKQITYMLLNIF